MFRLMRLAGLTVLLGALLLPVSARAQFVTLTPFTGTSTGTLLGTIRNIVNTLLGLAALIATIALIFSTATALSGRDEEEITRRARANIVFILLGIVVIALSAVVVNFIIVAIP